MLAVSYDASMLRRAPDGALQRAYWEDAARKGNAEAAAKLDVPPFPASLEYLYEWFGEVSAGRGDSMSGIPPLTHEGVRAWAEMCGHSPAPHEVRALLALDGAWRSALRDDPKDAKPAVTDDGYRELTPVKAWPDKKKGAS